MPLKNTIKSSAELLKITSKKTNAAKNTLLKFYKKHPNGGWGILRIITVKFFRGKGEWGMRDRVY